jgi:hypothetical protein
MCSTLADRLALIERAIDELAAESGTTGVQDRLVRLWQMVADLDPELTRRMAGYHGAGYHGAGDTPPGPDAGPDPAQDPDQAQA